MERIVRKKLSDSVLDEIFRMFESGELKEGDKLPNQNDLAAQLGVSRASLRESMHTLAILGVVEQRPGFGTVVRSRIPHNINDYLSLPMISDAKETIELVEARRFIEVGNAELAVKNGTDAQIEALRCIVEQMQQSVKAGLNQQYIEKDAEFHRLVAEATGNRFMVHLFLTIRRFMEQFLSESFSALPAMVSRSMEDHCRIFDAIQKRDRKQASREMTRHLINVQEAMENLYDVTHNRKESGNVD